MKMKKLKNVWLFLSFILMVAGMASCSTDDPTGVEVSRDDIIGTWKVTANSWSDSEEESGINDHVGQPLSLQSNGTAVFQGFRYSWVLDEKNGILTLSGSAEMEVKITILSLVGDEVKVVYSYKDKFHGYVAEGDYTFKRV